MKTERKELESNLTHEEMVTNVGKVLRKTSIDELPQIINILGVLGNNRLALQKQTNNNTYVAFPQMEKSPNQLQISFDVHWTDINTSISVGVMENPYDSLSFTEVKRITYTDGRTNQTVRYVVSLADYAGKGEYIAISTNSDSKVYGMIMAEIFIDNVLIEEINNCVRPEEVKLTEMFADSVRLEWKSIKDVNKWAVLLSSKELTLDELIDPLKKEEEKADKTEKTEDSKSEDKKEEKTEETKTQEESKEEGESKEEKPEDKPEEKEDKSEDNKEEKEEDDTISVTQIIKENKVSLFLVTTVLSYFQSKIGVEVDVDVETIELLETLLEALLELLEELEGALLELGAGELLLGAEEDVEGVIQLAKEVINPTTKPAAKTLVIFFILL